MPNKILIKRGSGTPTAGSASNQVDVGELALDTSAGRLFTNVGSTAVNLGVTSIAGQTINPANATVGTTNNTRVAITGAGGSNAISEYSTTEANPRWLLGRDAIGANLAGLSFGNGSSTIAAGGVAVGYAAAREMGFYTSNATALTERMRITSTGNVGIGITNPSSRLVVTGSSTTSGSNAINVTNSGLASLFAVRNDGLSTFTGQIANTRANVATTGSGQIYLNGTTGNRIDFNTNGVAPPDVTTRSAGTKICLYPIMNGTQGDYAIGIDNSTFWQSLPSANDRFKWYGGDNEIASLDGNGNFSCAGGITGGNSFTLSGYVVSDLSLLGVIHFYNGYPANHGASIESWTVGTSDENSLALRVSNANDYYPVVARYSGVIINSPNASESILATLDVRGDARIETNATVVGDATVAGSLTVQGGLRSPGEMLYLWSNFR